MNYGVNYFTWDYRPDIEWSDIQNGRSEVTIQMSLVGNKGLK